jgi:16S rRNA (cytidine1402-2'-O)-methyltransferase
MGYFPHMTPPRPPGILRLVATPIGNLEDITLRALRVLREAVVIAAEDTRTAAKLCARHGIATPLLSLHEHNEAARAEAIVARLRAGESVALVTDAGTPGISDPGARLVRAVADAGLRVEAVPGPCALVAAAACSGLPVDRFVFEGFLPARPAERRRAIEALRAEPRTLVFYEAPHRVVAALRDLAGLLGPREAAVARELTKIHEEVLRGTLPGRAETLDARGEPKGEFVLVVAGAGPEEGRAEPDDAALREALAKALATGASRRDAVAEVAEAFDAPRNRVYRLALETGPVRDG